MATFSERLAYVLTFDTTSGVKSLNEFGKAADKQLSKADKGWDKRSANLTKFGAASAAFAGVAGVGLFKLATGASEARQNFQALEQVVGDTAALNIKEWADDAAQSIGVSSAKAVEAARSFAQLGEVAGLGEGELEDFSVGLVELAADFAAFADVSPEQALQDIRSGFSGSTEVLRKYGIFLTEANLKQQFFDLTGKKVTGTLSAQERVLATNALLYEQGSTMIGQFERESDSLVGQTAILKAELGNLADGIGAGLLPMFRQGVETVGDFAEKLGNLSPETQSLIGKTAGLAVGLTGIVGALSFAGGQAIKLRGRFTTLGEDGSRSINKLGKSVRGVSIAFAAFGAVQAGIAIFNSVTNASENVETAFQKVIIAADKASKGLGGNLVDSFEELAKAEERSLSFSSAWEIWGKGIKLAGTDATIGIEALDDAFNKLKATDPATAQQFIDQLRRDTDLLDKSSGQYRDNIDLIGRFQSSLDLQTASQKALNDETEKTGPSMVVAGAAFEDYTKIVEASKVQTDEWVEAFKGVDSSIQTTSENLEDSKDAIQDWADGVNDAARNGAESFDEFEVDANTSLEAYTKNLIDTESAVSDWQDNLTTIAESTSADFAAEIASMGLSGVNLAAQIAEGGPDAQAAFDAYVTQAATFNTDMEAEFDKVGPGLQEAMQEAERLAFVEASLQLVELPREAKSIGEEYGKSFARGIGSAVGEVTTAATSLYNAAINAISGRTIVGPTVSTPNFSGGGTSSDPPFFFHDGGHVTRQGNGSSRAGLRNDEVPAVLQTGEYVMSRDDVAAASQGGGAGGVTVQLVGDIYGVPSEEFVAELADKLNKYAAGMA